MYNELDNLFNLSYRLDDWEMRLLISFAKRLVLETKIDMIHQFKNFLFEVDREGKKIPKAVWDFLGEYEDRLFEEREAAALEDPLFSYIDHKLQGKLEAKKKEVKEEVKQ